MRVRHDDRQALLGGAPGDAQADDASADDQYIGGRIWMSADGPLPSPA
jgi:hypothetical protein